MTVSKIIHAAKSLFVLRAEPVGLIHFLTRRCNARCSFCFIDFEDVESQNKKNEMTIQDIQYMTSTMGKSLQHVNLTGGEPFLRSDIFDIIKAYFDNAKVNSILINTNGSYPKKIDSLLNKLNEFYPEKKVIIQFSIDSYPEDHDKIRKIPGLFKRTMESYELVKKRGLSAIPSVALTCTHENYKKINEIYEFMKKKHGVNRFSAILVRDEGVFKTPESQKKGILEEYQKLTHNLYNDRLKGEILNFYNKNSFIGRVLNEKDKIQHENNIKSYVEPKFLSYCPSASIFGVIDCDGTVHPCEILDKPLGKLSNFNYNFLNLWRSEKTKRVKKWIKDSKCHCSYECAMTYNVMSNYKYQPRLIKKGIGL
jgi:radical SAM protein with 4Fe4S-binding SPASM domain